MKYIRNPRPTFIDLVSTDAKSTGVGAISIQSTINTAPYNLLPNLTHEDPLAGGADVTFQTNLEDGNYPRLSVLVTVTDEAGNESGPLSPGTFRVDNTPPEISSETAITYDNTTVTVTFDTVLYSNSTGTADGWQVDDFTASLSGGIAVTPIISSITNTVDLSLIHI